MQGEYKARQSERERRMRELARSKVRLISLVEEAARKSKVEIGQLRPETGEPNSDVVVESRVNLRATGLSVDRLKDFLERIEKSKGVVVVKSTITPDHLTRFKKTYKLSIVYNPEFLTEANSFEDFLNPSMQILGGKWKDCEAVEKAYVKHSSVKTVPTFKTDLITASLIKYTINSWLATKVTFFNELNTLFESSGTKVPWETFTEMISQDKRIGDTHMKVPGPDGEKGFGGHCFPKDTKALLYYAKLKKAELSILKKAIDKNDKIRNN